MKITTISLFLILFLLPIALYGQAGKKSANRFNLIISIDGERGQFYRGKIITNNNDSISRYVLNDVVIPNTEAINNAAWFVLKAIYADSKGLWVKYSIDIKKSWLNKDYVILEIFNRDNKKSRRAFGLKLKDFKDKEYAYCITTPDTVIFSPPDLKDKLKH